MGTPLRDYMIGGLLLTLAVTIVVLSITNVNKGDPLSDTGVIAFADDDELTKFNRSLNKLDVLQTNITTIKEKVTDTQPILGSDTISLAVAFVQTIWLGIKVIINSFFFLDSSFDYFVSFLGMPSVIGTIIKLIIILYLSFAIISLIFGKDT